MNLSRSYVHFNTKKAMCCESEFLVSILFCSLLQAHWPLTQSKVVWEEGSSIFWVTLSQRDLQYIHFIDFFLLVPRCLALCSVAGTLSYWWACSPFTLALSTTIAFPSLLMSSGHPGVYGQCSLYIIGRKLQKKLKVKAYSFCIQLWLFRQVVN